MTRIKSSPIASHGEFLALVNELAQLEIEHRTLAAQRDAHLAAIDAEFDIVFSLYIHIYKG